MKKHYLTLLLGMTIGGVTFSQTTTGKSAPASNPNHAATTTQSSQPAPKAKPQKEIIFHSQEQKDAKIKSLEHRIQALESSGKTKEEIKRYSDKLEQCKNAKIVPLPTPVATPTPAPATTK